MPKFQLKGADAVGFQALDEFTRGYVTAMFFTDASDPDDGVLQNATFLDLADVTLATIKADCAQFQAAAELTLVKAYRRGYAAEQAGADFWFTRNHHGVGYWDRSELRASGIGRTLTNAAQVYSERDLYRGDDGKVYFL